MPIDEFVARCNIKHNNKYHYSKVSYGVLRDCVDILCPDHGVFQCRALLHLHGFGKCCQCERAINPGKYTHTYFYNSPELSNQPGILYVIYFPMYDIIKVGITKHSVRTRYLGKGTEYKSLFEVNTSLYKAFCVEQEILSNFKHYRKGVYGVEGHTETFQVGVYGDIINFIHTRLKKMEMEANQNRERSDSDFQ
jgi:hypothetical protein